MTARDLIARLAQLSPDTHVVVEVTLGVGHARAFIEYEIHADADELGDVELRVALTHEETLRAAELSTMGHRLLTDPKARAAFNALVVTRKVEADNG